MRFERAAFSSQSADITEASLLEMLKQYLAENPCITRRDMQDQFGLRQSAALKWLKHFTEAGVLRKEGAKNSPVYLLNSTKTV